MSALFTDHNRKCIHCGERAGVWPDNEDGLPTCPSCGKSQDRSRFWGRFQDDCAQCGEPECDCETYQPAAAPSSRIYVDDARIPWRGKRWSHLTADTEEALHEFAAKIGLRREWFQPSSTRPEAHHYDVTDSKRDEAILAGAIPETTEEGARRRRARRAAA